MRNVGADNRLHEYYYRRFPAEVLCELLGRGWRGGSQLHKRELCIENTDSCYIRWLSVSGPQELRSLFRAKQVEKFHTGAIFSAEPRLKKKVTTIVPLEREFVVDIDVNDYDIWGVDPNDIESCDRAWPIVAFGFKIVKYVLRKHFGFSNMLLVYSGRRGAHMSVYDARACALTDEARSVVVSYLQPGDKLGKSGRLSYSSILKSSVGMELLESHIMPFWSNCCLKPREAGGMGVLDGPLEKEAFMDLLDNKHARETLSLARSTGAEMWSKLTKHADESPYKESAWLSLKETVMCYLWPRLDGAVSERRNHLSKSVFSIHPKTGRICVPITGDSYTFEPADCPTYTELVDGVESAEASFKTAVSALGRFVNILKTSGSESWSPPRLGLGLGTKYAVVSRKRGRDECEERQLTARVQQNHPSDQGFFHADTVRVFCALAYEAYPSSVSVYFYTTLVDPCVGEVLPGYGLPFRTPGAFPTNWVVKGVREASANPGTEVVLDRAYTCVLFHSRQTSKQRCEQRMNNMKEHLLDPNTLTTVDSRWDDRKLAEEMDCQVKEAWETKYIHLD